MEQQYDLITEDNSYEFVSIINKRLKDGWNLLGTFQIIDDKYNERTYYQAMVMITEEDK